MPRGPAGDRRRAEGGVRGPPNSPPPSKGEPNAREAFQTAFELLGGAEALAEWARGERRGEFYRMYARLISLAAGGAGEALEVEVLRFDQIDDGDAEDPAA